MKFLYATSAFIIALGAYAGIAQLINTEACNSAARFYESADAARVFAQILLVCI